MIMQQSFPELYDDDSRRTFVNHGTCLYPAFLEVAATVVSSNSRFTQIPRRYDLDGLANRIREANDQGEREALEEFRALREFQAKQRAESETEREREEAEKANLVLPGLCEDDGRDSDRKPAYNAHEIGTSSHLSSGPPLLYTPLRKPYHTKHGQQGNPI
ncbi:hypothetical protein F5883DRAFT_572637 [Diaporthe sp. PMI_573]|nr:hypothetical protein F5883DRAFT_572637 [Diaporthaceae sp. PMI_573]